MVTRMDYDRVEWLRRETQRAALDMFTVRGGESLMAPADVAASAFGNTSGGAGCASVWQSVVEHATAANASLRQAVDDDADRLLQVIACFRDTDHESADEICAAGDTLTVISAHLHSQFTDLPLNSAGTDAWNDYLRATQHDRLVDYAAGRSGAVVVGVDANVSIDPGEYDAGPLSPEAVQRFDAEGFENVGDFSHGRPGEGTSSGENSIDYVWARGVAADPNPREVEGAPSDHDGQAVDVTVPRW